MSSILNNKQTKKVDNEKILLEKTIRAVLIEIGIKVHIKGFRFWITAISYLINENEEDVKMTYLYDYVARKHKTTMSKSERAMRYAYQELEINSEYSTVQDYLKNYFSVPYSINNTAFLYLVRDLVAERLEKLNVVYETRNFVEEHK